MEKVNFKKWLMGKSRLFCPTTYDGLSNEVENNNIIRL